MTILPKIEELLNVKVSNNSLYEKLVNRDLPYFYEARDEIERLSNVYPERSVFNISRSCNEGKLAEILIREALPNEFAPMNIYAASDYASEEWIDRAGGLRKAGELHDIIAKTTGEVIEIKRWSPSTRSNKLPKFLKEDTSFNKSHILLLFSFTDFETWLSEIIILDK